MMQSAPFGRKTPHYWFHAKRYGWGWGLPASKEGWVVLAVFLVLQIGGSAALVATGQSFWMPFWIVGLALLLVAICWLKGEPPRWRWGEE